MSPNTFICFFGWLAEFKVDFRKEVDPWCGYNPEIMTCDGTHVGVVLHDGGNRVIIKMLRLKSI